MNDPWMVGAVIAGKYRVEEEIGRGGCGVVVAATHLSLGERVAIKFLPADASDESLARFEREAKTAAQIQSDHVIRILDIDRLPTGEPYIVMELLEGEDLSKLIARTGPLAIDEAVRLLLEASEALARAHVRGIVHRDLKPANLFLARGHGAAVSVKVLDFGLSRLMPGMSEGPQANLTQTGSVLGSPAYMAPEQWMSAKDADERSDVWALGAIAYELLTGKLPFMGEAMPQLCLAVMNAAPERLVELRPDIPAEFEAIVLKCLRKDSAERFQSLAELAQALARFAPPSAAPLVDRIVATLGPAAEAASVGPTMAAEPGTSQPIESVAVGVVSTPASPAGSVATAPTVLSDQQPALQAAAAPPAGAVATAPTVMAEQQAGYSPAAAAPAVAVTTAPSAVSGEQARISAVQAAGSHAASAPAYPVSAPAYPAAAPGPPTASGGWPPGPPGYTPGPTAPVPGNQSTSRWILLAVVLPVLVGLLILAVAKLRKERKDAEDEERERDVTTQPDEPDEPAPPDKKKKRGPAPELGNHTRGCCVNNAAKLAEPFAEYLEWRFDGTQAGKQHLVSLALKSDEAVIVVFDRERDELIPFVYDGQRMTEREPLAREAKSFRFDPDHFHGAGRIMSTIHQLAGKQGCTCQPKHMILEHRDDCRKGPCWFIEGPCRALTFRQRPKGKKFIKPRCPRGCSVICETDGLCHPAKCY